VLRCRSRALRRACGKRATSIPPERVRRVTRTTCDSQTAALTAAPEPSGPHCQSVRKVGENSAARAARPLCDTPKACAISCGRLASRGCQSLDDARIGLLQCLHDPPRPGGFASARALLFLGLLYPPRSLQTVSRMVSATSAPAAQLVSRRIRVAFASICVSRICRFFCSTANVGVQLILANGPSLSTADMRRCRWRRRGLQIRFPGLGLQSPRRCLVSA